MKESTQFTRNRENQKKLQVLSRIFWKEADQNLLNQLSNGSNPFDDESVELRGGLALIKGFISDSSETRLTDLAVDYTNIFIGFHPEAPFPYESIYTSPERILMQDARDEVLQIYQESGFEIPFSGNEPEDHLGIELAFMAFLSQKIAQSYEKGEEEAAVVYEELQQQFIQQHLANWIPVFCKDVEAHAETDFYKGVARITETYLASLQQ